MGFVMRRVPGVEGGRLRRASTTPSTEVVKELFVYGTLRAGHSAHSMLNGYAEDVRSATCTGRLVAFDDGYPGLVEDESATVVGELVTLRDLAPAFALLDAYEGDDFRRVLKQVRTKDERELWAWCYVLASENLAEGCPVVAHGDWLRYERDA